MEKQPAGDHSNTATKSISSIFQSLPQLFSSTELTVGFQYLPVAAPTRFLDGADRRFPIRSRRGYGEHGRRPLRCRGHVSPHVRERVQEVPRAAELRAGHDEKSEKNAAMGRLERGPDRPAVPLLPSHGRGAGGPAETRDCEGGLWIGEGETRVGGDAECLWCRAGGWRWSINRKRGRCWGIRKRRCWCIKNRRCIWYIFKYKRRRHNRPRRPCRRETRTGRGRRFDDFFRPARRNRAGGRVFVLETRLHQELGGKSRTSAGRVLRPRDEERGARGKNHLQQKKIRPENRGISEEGRGGFQVQQWFWGGVEKEGAPANYGGIAEESRRKRQGGGGGGDPRGGGQGRCNSAGARGERRSRTLSGFWR